MAAQVLAQAVAVDVNPIENILPVELISRIEATIRSSQWKYGWRSNEDMGYAHWNHDFGGVKNDNTSDISGKLTGAIKDAWTYLESNYFPGATLIRCYTNAHTFGVEGYPHTDSSRDRDVTLVIYMNREWKREWGGETIIYDGNNIAYAELPKFNKGLVFPGNKWHTARGLTRICPALRITLMYKVSLPEGMTIDQLTLTNIKQTPIPVDPTRTKLLDFFNSIGADDIPHSSRVLTTHLINTYDLLRAAHRPETTCLAGACHSIFGTNIFKSQCLDKQSDMDMLVEEIGQEAADLVVLFGEINRPSTLNNSMRNGVTTVSKINGDIVDVGRQNFDALCAIEAANLFDQSALSQFDKLSELWKVIYNSPSA